MTNEELINKKIGKLTILSIFVKKTKTGKNRVYANCKCDCGGEKIALVGSLNSGYVKSCGCLKHKNKLIKDPNA